MNFASAGFHRTGQVANRKLGGPRTWRSNTAEWCGSPEFSFERVGISPAAFRTLDPSATLEKHSPVDRRYYEIVGGALGAREFSESGTSIARLLRKLWPTQQPM